MIDATNTTRERRRMLSELICGKYGFRLFFVESICDDLNIIEANILVRTIFTTLSLLHVYHNHNHTVSKGMSDCQCFLTSNLKAKSAKCHGVIYTFVRLNYDISLPFNLMSEMVVTEWHYFNHI